MYHLNCQTLVKLCLWAAALMYKKFVKFLFLFSNQFSIILNLTDFLHIHTQDVIRHIDIEEKHEREINYLGGAVHYLWFFIFLFLFFILFLSRLCLAASQKIIS